MWQKDLYRGGVYVTGTRPPSFDVLADVPIVLPPFTLVGLLSEIAIRETLASLGILDALRSLPLRPPFKVVSLAAPLLLTGQEQFRLAHLWLLRDGSGDPMLDEIYVQQTAYWSFAAWQIIEDGGLLSLVPAMQALSDAGNLVAQEVVKTLLDSAQVHWWTV
jgi:hypothetical protein